MKDFRDFYLKGSRENLLKFVSKITEYIAGEWKQGTNSMFKNDFIIFDYCGNEVNKASVFLYIKDIDQLRFQITNIVPTKKHSLNFDEYNQILEKCVNECITPCAKECDLEFDMTSENVELENFMSKESAEKLKKFSACANKSTGSSHPCDKARWNDFICQTFVDGHINVINILGRWLSEEEGWDDEHVSELVIEYEQGISLLSYYKGHYHD